MSFGLMAIIMLIFSNNSNGRSLSFPCYAIQIDTLLPKIDGRVFKADGQPVSGATVRVKGSSDFVLTDAKGRFSLTRIKDNATFIISHIGLKTVEEKVAGRSPIFIRMVPANLSLQQVDIVSTGYQNIPKERATGAFTYIDNKLFNEQVSTDILSRLPTVANGLTINNKINNGQIMIRGLSTINSPMDPLIIVDNFPYKGDLKNINPNDVKSITLLKDAAASSIWGTKAGNGVIVITTKSGRLNQPLAIEVNSNITIGEKPNLFYLKNIPTSDYIDVEKFLFSQQYHFSDTSNYMHSPFSPVYEILFRERDGQITQQDADKQIDALRRIDIRNEFLKYMYQKPVNQQYNINMHGGSNKATYYFSTGMDNNLDNLASRNQRLTLQLKNTYMPVKNLKISTGIYYTQNKTESGRPPYGGLQVMGSSVNKIPYIPFADKNGNPLPVALKYRQPYIDTLDAGKLLNWNYYPLEDYKHSRTTNHVKNVTLNFGINYKINNTLNIDFKYQYLRESTNNKTLYDLQSFYARDMINLYSEIDPNTGSVTYNIPMGGILDQSSDQLTSQDVRGQINFDRTWSKNNISVIGGAEITQLEDQGNAYRTYGYDNDILTYENVDFDGYYPTLIGFGGYIPDGRNFSSTLNRSVSVYANAAYTYGHKYIFSISGRRDGSNLFGATTKNKWKPLWSSGVSWIVSNEDFYHVPFLQYLKLRATYGYSGNTNPSQSGITTIGIQDVSRYTGGIRTFVANFYNPDLKWETVGQLNLGFDFGLFDNRISGSLDYYTKKASDLIAPLPVDPTTGLGQPTVERNVGIMRTSGIDLAIHSLNIDENIKWSTTLNLNTNKDKILKYNATTSATSIASRGFAFKKGRPVYAVYSYRWAGLDPQTGDPRGYLDGKISEDYTALTASNYNIDDLIYNGPKFPTIFGSIGNTVSYKHITLSFWLTYKFHYFFRRQSVAYGDLFNGNAEGNYDYVNRWKKPGDEKHTNVPSMTYPASGPRDDFYTLSEVLIDKGDNIRLQYINISYELTKEKLPSFPFKSLKVYIYLNNIGIVWRANKDGLDPDYLEGAIPPAKTMTLGLNINF